MELIEKMFDNAEVGVAELGKARCDAIGGRTGAGVDALRPSIRVGTG
jgi:hypothetical protein